MSKLNIDIPSPDSITTDNTYETIENYLLSAFCLINQEWFPIKIFNNLSDISKYIYEKYNLHYSSQKLKNLKNDQLLRVYIINVYQ
jgi:hypothetical protein